VLGFIILYMFNLTVWMVPNLSIRNYCAGAF